MNSKSMSIKLLNFIFDLSTKKNKKLERKYGLGRFARNGTKSVTFYKI